MNVIGPTRGGNEADAVTAAEAIGFPVVLKLYSHTITHKTDVGGVKLNLTRFFRVTGLVLVFVAAGLVLANGPLEILDVSVATDAVEDGVHKARRAMRNARRDLDDVRFEPFGEVLLGHRPLVLADPRLPLVG